MSNAPTWMDGRRVRSLPSDSRGLHYGDGAFRTILKYDNKYWYLTEHINKLVEDGIRLDLQVSADHLAGVVERAGRGRPRGTLKLIIVRQSGERGYQSLTRNVNIICQWHDINTYSREHLSLGIVVDLSDVTLAAQPRLAGVKHLNRLEQVLASRNWPSGVQERLMTDAQLQPICGTRSNLFWISGGQLYTPDVANCGVAGVMRSQVLQTAGKIGVACCIECRPLAELLAADEAFVCNSVFGLWPLRALGQRRWSAPGPLTRMLSQALAHPYPCEISRTHG